MKKYQLFFIAIFLNFYYHWIVKINNMGSKREKYPEKCPWDLGPNQHLSKEDNWTLRLGEANVCFSKNKLDNNYFHVISNENEEQILAFRARLLYQKLLDKGFRLVE